MRSVACLAVQRRSEVRISIQLVNNGLTDTTEAESSFHELNQNNPIQCDLSVISGQGNVGYGSAQNIAFKLEASKYHVFMNPDVRVFEDSLAEGLEYLDKCDDAVALSPTCSDGEEKQFLCKRYPSVFDLSSGGFFLVHFRRFLKPDRSLRNARHSRGRPTPGGSCERMFYHVQKDFASRWGL